MAATGCGFTWSDLAGSPRRGSVTTAGEEVRTADSTLLTWLLCAVFAVAAAASAVIAMRRRNDDPGGA